MYAFVRRGSGASQPDGTGDGSSANAATLAEGAGDAGPQTPGAGQSRPTGTGDQAVANRAPGGPVGAGGKTLGLASNLQTDDGNPVTPPAPPGQLAVLGQDLSDVAGAVISEILQAPGWFKRLPEAYKASCDDGTALASVQGYIDNSKLVTALVPFKSQLPKFSTPTTPDQQAAYAGGANQVAPAIDDLAIQVTVGKIVGALGNLACKLTAPGSSAAASALGSGIKGGIKAVGAAGAVGSAQGVIQGVRDGDSVAVLGNGVGLLQGLLGLFGTSCFAAGTPIRTPDGDRPIEGLRVGDLVLSAPSRHPRATRRAPSRRAASSRPSPNSRPCSS